MSLDKSLKSHGELTRHRNVLTRAERIEKLMDEEKWDEEEDSVLGLPKVAHRKVATRKKSAAAEAEAAEGEEVPVEGEAGEAAEPAGGEG